VEEIILAALRQIQADLVAVADTAVPQVVQHKEVSHWAQVLELATAQMVLAAEHTEMAQVAQVAVEL
jgi:hypothetical protein